MVTVAYSTSQTTLGLAVEVTRGTPVAPAYWLPIKAPKYKPDLILNPDETLQGSMVQTYDLIAGQRYDSHGWDSFPYMDTFPNLLRAELGSSDNKTAAPSNTTLAALCAAGASTISSTASIAAGSWIVIDGATDGLRETHYTTAVSGTGPYTLTLAYPTIYAHINTAPITGLTKHNFSLLNNAGTGNQPPTYTLTDYDGEEWRQLPSAQLDKLTIKGTGTGLIEYTCSWFADPSITPATPTASFTSVEAVPGWSSDISIGGTQIKYLVDWELDLSRGVKPIPAITGTQAYFDYFAGPLQAKFKITVVEQSGAPELSKFLANSFNALDLTIWDTQNGYACNFHSSKTKFQTGELDRSKEWVQATLDGMLLPTSTDALAGGVSPIVCSVGNAVSASY